MKSALEKHIKSATTQIKRLAIMNFWDAHANKLERQAVALFRAAGEARENARLAMRLPDDGVEKVFEALMGKPEVKTVVEPGEGKERVQ